MVVFCYLYQFGWPACCFHVLHVHFNIIAGHLKNAGISSAGLCVPVLWVEAFVEPRRQQTALSSHLEMYCNQYTELEAHVHCTMHLGRNSN